MALQKLNDQIIIICICILSFRNLTHDYALFLYEGFNIIGKEFNSFKTMFQPYSQFYIPYALKLIKLCIWLRKADQALDQNSGIFQNFLINFLKELEFGLYIKQNYSTLKVKKLSIYLIV